MSDADGELGAETPESARAPSLDSLLARLAGAGDIAPEYERLRWRLVTYFRLRFPAEAEALADEAIDRLARRLNDGTPVQNLAAYALGIARLIVLETHTRQNKERAAAREAVLQAQLAEPAAPERESEAALAALRACLEGLGAEAAGLILDYYGADDGAARIERRQRLAERAGLSLNALRNRALRIRMTLERCVRARLAAGTAPAREAAGDETANSHTKESSRQGSLR
jgi:DNA-directed RNA polymerase specialized sigma24 family protein